MRGVVILGGLGKRLNLFSRRVNNKALAPVYDRLVFEYPLNTLVRAGITEITIVLGGRYAGDIVNCLGDGKEFGIEKLHYVYQKEALGISHAIYQAKNSLEGQKVAVILGDNFFDMDITPHIQIFKDLNLECGVFLKDVPDPERYGVAVVNKQNEIENIIEKPINPPSNLAVTGLYFYDHTLFQRIEKLKPSARGELEITDLNMTYVKEKKCHGFPVTGYWNDMGTYDSILETANHIKNTNFKLSYTIDAWKGY